MKIFIILLSVDNIINYICIMKLSNEQIEKIIIDNCGGENLQLNLIDICIEQNQHKFDFYSNSKNQFMQGQYKIDSLDSYTRLITRLKEIRKDLTS